ncbi:peptidylprolyl isomerase [Pseudoroseomonas rhizosphaerae]|uniref:Parvulin-like PPIase n=1 Tax=Teichococcus rhizosphaerae TaxID=1335062 RepID=A0A2C7AH74_9PROT|nr:peptidylprolyl isomerase [Pseudoroseomonas rhizosphaerae]PHK96067.1 peptidylprolyl isomerase [Pseudoroseomonas rhizosphaerae]
MRSTALILPLLLAAAPVLAQPAPSPAPAAPPAAQPPVSQPQASQGQAAANPVVARIDQEELRLSDVQAAIAELPPELRGAPGPMLFPLVLDQLIAQKALVAAARSQGLDRDEAVRSAIRRAEEEQLQQALLRREIAPALTEEALRARYQKEIAGKPGEEEVHARHILTATEAEARAALAELRKPGADFAAVAKQRSTGPGTQQGGDLGFFKKSDMVPEFADAAFGLKAGEVSREPVKSPFGWHVIKVEARRMAPAPSFEDSAESLRQAAFEEAVNDAVERVQAKARIERFNMDGSPRTEAPAPSLLDGAAPPAAQPRR